jgi:nucleotide-binding universal stress UspA family protein
MNKTSPQSIICGTDFSKAATLAGNVAAAFSIRLDAPLLLVHGVDERGEIASMDWPAMTEQCRPQLWNEAERLRKTGAEVDEVIADGVPDDGVAYRAERANARMIVLASAGYNAFDRWTLGSVSERIAELAWVPTLVVRQNARLEDWARGGPPLRIFVAADFTSESDAAMAWAAGLREIGPCEYTVGFVDRWAREQTWRTVRADAKVAVVEETHEKFARELRQRAVNYLPKETVHVRVLPTTRRVDHALLELAEEASAELIVVGTHQWHGLSRVWHRSVSRHLLRAAPISVACVPNRRVVASTSPCYSKAHRVLVVTDLSPHDSVAIPYAFSMLQRGGTACFLHVARPGEDRSSKLEQLRSLIPPDAQGQGFHVESEVVMHGDPAEAICEASHRLDTDLICLGVHDFSAGLTTPVGPTALAVLARTSRPVLLIPQQVS